METAFNFRIDAEVKFHLGQIAEEWRVSTATVARTAVEYFVAEVQAGRLGPGGRPTEQGLVLTPAEKMFLQQLMAERGRQQ